MKNAKKLMALILGVIMTMGCLSVSAANNDITVTEKPVKTYFETDFSEASANVEIAESVTTSVDGGFLKVLDTNTASAENKAFIYAKSDKTGIAEPVFVEFNISQNGLFHYSNNSINMFFLSEDGGFIDLTWFSGKTLRLYQDASNQYSVPCEAYSIHVKLKIDPLSKKYTVWVNGEEISGQEDNNYIRNSAKFTDFAYLQLKTTGKMTEVLIDNFIVYSEPQTAFPMVEEIFNESYDSEGGSKTLTAANNDFDISGVVPGENVAYEVDIVGETGNSNMHYIMFRNDDKGIYSRVEWSKSGSNDVMKLRVWDTASKYIISDAKVSDYTANSDKLKITAVFSADCGNLKVYINGVFFHEYNFANKDGIPKVLRLGVGTGGSITVDNIRVYKFTKELSITEDENTVKIITPETKSGNIYFAKYDSDDEVNKSLENIGIARLNLVPGKIYTVDKTEWNGAKAFLWDENLAPIVDPWNLSQAE